MTTKNAKRIFDNTKHLLKMAPIVTGCTVEFTYNGKPRTGKIEKIGTSDNGDWFCVELADGTGYRNFTIAKCSSLAVK